MLEIVDGTGKTIVPGLFDMHAHAQAGDGILNIASGVTTVRDMGNDIDELRHLQDQWDTGSAIGPRVWKSGFIDGHGPYQAPTGLYADTAEEAQAAVNRYADLGYVQIKVYSSLNPEFVPGIVKTAHARGLRVSGHIPNGMIASQFVEAGADEIQHINFIFLNFIARKGEGHSHSRAVYRCGRLRREARPTVKTGQRFHRTAAPTSHHRGCDPGHF